jgi:hypothetical protein
MPIFETKTVYRRAVPNAAISQLRSFLGHVVFTGTYLLHAVTDHRFRCSSLGRSERVSPHRAHGTSQMYVVHITL